MCRVQDLVCFMTMPIGFSNDNLCYGFRGGGVMHRCMCRCGVWSIWFLVCQFYIKAVSYKCDIAACKGVIPINSGMSHSRIRPSILGCIGPEHAFVGFKRRIALFLR